MRYLISKGSSTACAMAVAVFWSLLSAALFAQGAPPEATKLDVHRWFSPSGYMGDGEYGKKYISFDGAYRTNPHSSPTCIRIQYTFGPKRWAGMYWLNKPDNWGDKPGNDYSRSAYKKLTFWARGQTGNEILEFKAGDIDNPSKRHRDSFAATTGTIGISRDWRQYSVDLSRANLSSVIGGFCWVANGDNNAGRSQIVVYLDDIVLER